MNPAEGIKDILEAAGVGVFAATTGWSINIAQEPELPETTITIFNTGGKDPNPKWLLDYPSVQIRVRGTQNGYLASRAKIQEIKDYLLGFESQTVNGDFWNHINGMGDIQDLGNNENNQPLHTVNFALIIEPADNPNDNRLPLA